MKFAEALLKVQNGEADGMRLPKWKEDVEIRLHTPGISDKMTHPYLYAHSRFGNVPWRETVPEMFDETWELVYDITKPVTVKEDKLDELELKGESRGEEVYA